MALVRAMHSRTILGPVGELDQDGAGEVNKDDLWIDV
jgi:hypothetical protein